MRGDEGPWASAEVFKAHGHGNDYLVVRAGEDWCLSRAAVQSICDPHRGVGGDGIVWIDPSTEPFPLRMYNPDGGEFEKSGNGLRVSAAWLWRAGLVRSDAFGVVVGGEEVTMQVHGLDPDEGLDVEVAMGTARFGADAVGFTGGAPLTDADGAFLDTTLVSMGNPHCVVFGIGRERALERLGDLGPLLATHERFASGTNVQLATVEGTDLSIAIWERGVGRTASSGTSACAATAAAVRRGLLPSGRHRVRMEGGAFEVTVTDGFEVTLRGPVRAVFEGRLDRDFVRSLERGG